MTDSPYFLAAMGMAQGLAFVPVTAIGFGGRLRRRFRRLQVHLAVGFVITLVLASLLLLAPLYFTGNLPVTDAGPKALGVWGSAFFVGAIIYRGCEWISARRS